MFLTKARRKLCKSFIMALKEHFACLQPVVDCQRLRYAKEAQDDIVFWAVLLEIPNTVPTNSNAAACLASLSAISFPGTLLCPGTQSTLLKVESLLSADLVSATRLDLVLADCSAFSAAWLSEHIAIEALRSLYSEETQARLAYISASKTVLYLPRGKVSFKLVVWLKTLLPVWPSRCSHELSI